MTTDTTTTGLGAWSCIADAPEALALRRAVVAYAEANGMAGRSDDIALAVAEALANAVVHAYVDLPPGDITVRAAADDDGLVVTVCDDGLGLVPHVGGRGLGLGLAIMAAVSDRFTVETRLRGGTKVVLTFDARDGSAPAPAEAAAS